MSTLPPEEIVGNIAAESIANLYARLKEQRSRTAALLKNVGELARCRGCNAEIIWVRHRVTHKNTPYDADGVNHFATCPRAADFRKKESNHGE